MLDIRQVGGQVEVAYQGWSCRFCKKVFADGDIHSDKELKALGLTVKSAIIEYWFDMKPVCEDCAVDRKLPKD